MHCVQGLFGPGASASPTPVWAPRKGRFLLSFDPAEQADGLKLLWDEHEDGKLVMVRTHWHNTSAHTLAQYKCHLYVCLAFLCAVRQQQLLTGLLLPAQVYEGRQDGLIYRSVRILPGTDGQTATCSADVTAARCLTAHAACLQRVLSYGMVCSLQQQLLSAGCARYRCDYTAEARSHTVLQIPDPGCEGTYRERSCYASAC